MKLAKMYKTVYEFAKSVHSSVSKSTALESVSISWTSTIEISLLCSSVFEREFFIITKK